MKMKMKLIQKTSLIIVLLFFMVPLQAQRIGYKEITEKRIEFIAPRLALTARESEKFWPLYREFYDQREQISQKTKQKNNQIDNKQPMTDEEFLNAIYFLIDSKIDQANLMKDFTKKYLEILRPEKVFRLFQLEDEFNRGLLNQLKESGPDRREPRSGPGPGPEKK
jgi:hypothetical protein